MHTGRDADGPRVCGSVSTRVATPHHLTHMIEKMAVIEKSLQGRETHQRHACCLIMNAWALERDGVNERENRQNEIRRERETE